MSATPRPIATLGGPSLVVLAFLLGSATSTQAIDLRWVGQDGHDLVGKNPGPAGDDYQDIHLVVRGIAPRRKVVHALVRGYGGGEWSTDKPQGQYLVVVVRKPNATTADLYIAPYMAEVGRDFEVHLKYDTGEEVVAYVRGGKADPNLRVGGKGMTVAWLGPDGSDRVGLTPSVGPDGLEDVRLGFANLTAGGKIKAVTVEGPGRVAWASGLNPEGRRNADFRRDPTDPTRGVLAIGIDRDLAGQPLKAVVTYEEGRADTRPFVGGPGHPARLVRPQPLANVTDGGLSALWLGQEGTGAEAEAGAVRVTLDGLEPGRTVAALLLTDGVVGSWAWNEMGQPAFPFPGETGRLSILRPGPSRVELAFSPWRDEAGATMTLRVRDSSGAESIVTFAGGQCDVARLAPALPEGSVVARPGDDLQGLVDHNGTVTLASGTHVLRRPLVLSRPARVVGQPGAVLRFDQEPDQPGWTAAIKVHRGGTTLEGFAVRFAGPTRWDQEVSYGPAVIGSTDNRDPAQPGPRHAVVLRHLDLEAPPAPSDQWTSCLNLVRLNTATSGRIEGNELRGGSVMVEGGPWSIVDNIYRGTPPHTFAYDAFAGHYTHDVLIARNRVQVDRPSGKTWRFLVLTQRGAHDIVTDNQVVGIGAREDDPIPHPNAPELILTEAYRLHFEGKPAAISPDGRVVAIPEPQGSPFWHGDAVAILSGPMAGQWRTVTMPLGPRTFLLDRPIDTATDAISIATGFTDETFSGNTVDTRGSHQAANLVLAGNTYGARVVKNHLLGGSESIRLVASASEDPIHWGWSRAPWLGGLIEGNILEDATSGRIDVEHSIYTKSHRGRVYVTATLLDNIVRRTKNPSAKPAGPMLRIGGGPALDPDDIRVTERGTRFEGTTRAADLRVHAVVNGQVVRDRPPR